MTEIVTVVEERKMKIMSSETSGLVHCVCPRRTRAEAPVAIALAPFAVLNQNNE